MQPQKRVLRQLKASREELAYAHEKALVTLYSIGDAVITTDEQGRIEHLNPIAEQLTEWTREQARGLPSRRGLPDRQ
ncbi:PAS domain-containing protein [Thiohalorhabdus sp.]|uniref:PAS domain-containing protein n=1 Tax=Thiohalorhabdus sp. TaxID=3094134 RepID=UPI002FC307A4